MSAKAFTSLVQQHLRGSTLIAVKEVFKKAGIRFTRTAFEKAIPFGVGVVTGAGTDKALTWYVGIPNARTIFKTAPELGLPFAVAGQFEYSTHLIPDGWLYG